MFLKATFFDSQAEFADGLQRSSIGHKSDVTEGQVGKYVGNEMILDEDQGLLLFCMFLSQRWYGY